MNTARGNTFVLAWRNVLRNRRRTLLTLAAIGIATMAIVMLGGYVGFTIRGMQTMTVRDFGHLQIMKRGYLDFGRANPARYAIADEDALIARLTADPVLKDMIVVATPQLQMQGVAGHFESGNSSTFVGIAWNPVARHALMQWDGLNLGMAPAQTRLDATQAGDGVIGVGLAQLLGLCGPLKVPNCAELPPEPAQADAPAAPADLATLSAQARQVVQTTGPAAAVQMSVGQGRAGVPGAAQAVPAPHAGAATVDAGVPVELLAASASGAPNVVRMNVVQAEQQGVRDLDRMYASMPLALGQRLVFGPGQGGATSIVVQLVHTRQMEAARARIEAVLREAGHDDLEVRPFADISPAYNQVVAMFGTMFTFVSILMGVVTLFSVANTVNMAVSERIGEIGTLRAIGLKRAQVRRMFVTEGALIGALGAVAGLAIAVLISVYGVNAAGLTWTPPGNAAAVPIRIDIAGSLRLCAGSVIVLTLLAAVSSWWPARRAARLEIVEALRHV